MESVESQIAEWRAYVVNAPGVNGQDVDELEDHLRQQITELNAAGLTADEGFLIAVKRLGDVDSLSREFAREHSDRLWKQLVLAGDDESEGAASGWLEAVVLAAGAAIAIQVARLAAGFPDGEEPTWFVRDLSLFVLPFLAAYFARRRQLDTRQWVLTAVPFALAALVVNLYPYGADSDTEVLVALHLPVVLWFVVAYPYMGGTVRSHERRMDFVRFTGEWFIYYVLIALGGGVLMALTAGILEPTGVDVDRIAEWVLPSGAAGAVIVAAWLVESKQRVVENMAVCRDVGLRRRRLCRDRSWRRVRSRAPQHLRRPAAGRARARPVRDVRAGLILVAELVGRHPVGRRRQRPRARRDRARRDDRSDRRPRVQSEPNGSARPQSRPPCEPRGGRLAIGQIPHATLLAPPARALANRLPPRLRPVGRHRCGHPPAGVRLRLTASTDHPIPIEKGTQLVSTEDVRAYSEQRLHVRKRHTDEERLPAL